MVILVFYVGYRRGLHFIYLFAVLIQTNTVVVVVLLLLFFDGKCLSVKRSYSNKTNQRSTGYYLRNVFLKIET